jgi:hypothetical protein
MIVQLEVLFFAVLAVAQSQPGPSVDGADLQRTRMESDPVTILEQLQSPIAAERKTGFGSLGFKATDDDVKFPPVARLLFENLDEDDDLEAVLGFEQTGAAIVIVMDRAEGSWWKVGQFTNAWRSSGDLDETVQVRDVIENGRSEIMIRDSGGGTDIAETHLSIYRLQSGRLHRVFRVSEESRYRVVGAQDPETATYERAWLSYPDREEAGAPMIVVDRTKTVIGPTPELNPDRQLRVAPGVCEVYRWNGEQEGFVADSSAASTLCATQAPAVKGSGRQAKAAARRR